MKTSGIERMGVRRRERYGSSLGAGSLTYIHTLVRRHGLRELHDSPIFPFPSMTIDHRKGGRVTAYPEAWVGQ